MRKREALALLAIVVAPLAGGCNEQSPFETIPEEVVHGTDQIWELGLEGFPAAFDLPSGQRFVVGASSISGSFGTVVLEGREDDTLVFRSFATLAPDFSFSRVGIQDLGSRSFDSVTEVPEGGYTLPSDSTGVPIVAGHTYAVRITTTFSSGIVGLNYGKITVLEVDRQFPADPRSRFVRFEWAYQVRPQDVTVAVEEDGT
ncbi:MAG: hypothetical protein ABR527_06485 [Gemmatimonadota bacterium]